MAAINLEFANQLCREFGQPENITWREVRRKLYLPYDSKLDYHFVFEDFNISDRVKLADVVLLGFPLMVSLNSSTRANDLTVYESVWSANTNGSGSTNYLSAASGYLQSVLYGYGGARFHDDNMTFDPKLIPVTTKVKSTGINYRGCSFDIEYDASDSMTLTLTSIQQGNRSLDALFRERITWEQMIEGQDIEMRRQRFVIRTSQY